MAATCISCASFAGVAAHKLDQGTDQLIRYTLSVWPEADDAAWLGWDAGGERGDFSCSLHLMLVKLIVKPALKVNP